MAALHRDSAERGGASLRVVDWYLGLSLGQKIVVGVAVGTLVFVGSYLASLLIFSVAGVERADSPPQGQTPAPGEPKAGGQSQQRLRQCQRLLSARYRAEDKAGALGGR
jgi:hypothetical protein